MIFSNLRKPDAFFVYASALLLATQYAVAQNAQEVRVSLKVLRVTTTENKKEILVPADQVKPGDMIEYQATYSNTNPYAIKNLQATLPIPPSME